MPKRGDKLPWRMHYVWVESGVEGTETFRTEAEAERRAARIWQYAKSQHATVETTITKREV